MIYIVTDNTIDSINAAGYFNQKYGDANITTAIKQELKFDVKITIKGSTYDRINDYIVLINTLPPVRRYATELAELTALNGQSKLIWLDTDAKRIDMYTTWFNHITDEVTQRKSVIQGMRQRGGDIVALTRKYLQLPANV